MGHGVGCRVPRNMRVPNSSSEFGFRMRVAHQHSKCCPRTRVGVRTPGSEVVCRFARLNAYAEFDSGAGYNSVCRMTDSSYRFRGHPAIGFRIRFPNYNSHVSAGFRRPRSEYGLPNAGSASAFRVSGSDSGHPRAVLNPVPSGVGMLGTEEGFEVPGAARGPGIGAELQFRI